jgi:hypothetical protein
MWHGHQIRGKDTYLTPWKSITAFSCNVATKLAGRFPSTPFLEALDILNPKAWFEARDKRYEAGNMEFHLTVLTE